MKTRLIHVFHLWEPWSDPFPTISTDAKPPVIRIEQEHDCRRCGKTMRRRIGPPSLDMFEPDDDDEERRDPNRRFVPFSVPGDRGGSL